MTAVRDNADREGVLWSLGCLPYLTQHEEESEWDDGDTSLGRDELADLEMAPLSPVAEEEEVASDMHVHGQDTAERAPGACGAMPSRSDSGAAFSGDVKNAA